MSSDDRPHRRLGLRHMCHAGVAVVLGLMVGSGASATGQCDGVSAAYDLEGVPAYLPPSQLQVLLAPAAGGGPNSSRR